MRRSGSLRRDVRCVSGSRESTQTNVSTHFSPCLSVNLLSNFPPFFKLKEDELKSRLRAKSARVRVPARSMSPEEDEDTSPFSDAGHKPEDPLNAPPQISYSANESSETVSAGDGRQSRDTQMKKEDRVEAKESGENNNVVAITQEGDLSDSADSDISFQHATAIDEVF